MFIVAVARGIARGETMNRQTLTIGAVLFAVVVVAFGIAVWLDGDDSGSSVTIPAGPGQAAEARNIIADIERERSRDTSTQPAQRQVELLGDGDDAGQPVSGGAIAETPAPAPAVAAGAGADSELDAAYQRARELQAAGQLDDAQVLLFFGARQGHSPSAFSYAEMNDPNHHSAATSLLAEPDAFQAYRWYTAAAEGGMEAADGRLIALREWAETEAAAGNSEAERLLLQWER